MKLKNIFCFNQSAVLVCIGVLLFNCKLITSSYSDSVEEEQFLDVEEDDILLTSLENSVPVSTATQQQSESNILINAKDILNFIHATRRSQNEMFSKIETLAKSVESTDKHKQDAGVERHQWELKLTALENRVLDLERALATKLQTFGVGRPQFQESHTEFTRQSLPHPSTSTPRPPPHYLPPSLPTASRLTKSLSMSANLNSISSDPAAAGFQIEQPFTPRPLYTTPTFPARNSRSRNTAPSFFSLGGSGSRIFSTPPPVPILYNTRLPETRGEGVQGHNNRPSQLQMTTAISTTTEELPEASASDEDVDVFQPTSGTRKTGGSQNLNTIMKKVLALERTVIELQQNVSISSSRSSNNPYMQTSERGSGGEISEVKEKQGQLQRAVDTVIISFSEIFRNIEKVEGKVEACCGSGSSQVANSNVQISTTPQPTTTTVPPPQPSTRPPYSFPWGSRGTTHRPFGTHRDREMFHQHQSFGLENDLGLGHHYDDGSTATTAKTTFTTMTTMATDFADYGRTPEIENENEDPWDDDSYSRSNNNDNSWTDHVSAEREEPDPEPIDFATYAFLKPQAAAPGRKLATKSLRTAIQSDEGQNWVAHDLSVLAKKMTNLTKQVGQQRRKIDTLSSELTKVNVTHFLLLRALDDDSIKRSIRPRDCSEIQLLLQLQRDHDKTQTNSRITKNGTHPQNQDRKKSTKLSQSPSSERKGKYTIFPKQNDDPVQVICDLSPNSDGGGWTIIQRRGTPSLNESRRTNFFRNWTQYEDGFGQVDGDYWIGLSNIADLTRLKDQELRIELTKWDGDRGIASFRYFRIDPAPSLYRLHVSGYSGTVGDSLSRHNDMAFSTFDSDNDSDTGRNCALEWKGAWWYYGCHESNLNGMYATNSNGTHDFGTGIVWQNWTGNYYSLKKVEIKIRSRLFSRLRKF